MIKWDDYYKINDIIFKYLEKNKTEIIKIIKNIKINNSTIILEGWVIDENSFGEELSNPHKHWDLSEDTNFDYDCIHNHDVCACGMYFSEWFGNEFDYYDDDEIFEDFTRRLFDTDYIISKVYVKGIINVETILSQDEFYSNSDPSALELTQDGKMILEGKNIKWN